MNRSIQNYLVLALLGLLLGAWGVSGALACNVPVFRYALERWPVDPYMIVIFHKGPLDDAQQKQVDKLEDAIVGDKIVGQNLEVWKVDLNDDLTDEQKKIVDMVKPKTFPWLFVQYPNSNLTEPPAYSGTLDPKVVSVLTDSPRRQAIAKLLLKGESVVWLFIESGNKEADEKAANLLKSELVRMQKQLRLPVLQASDDRYIDKEAGPELKLSFKMVRMSRKEVGESMFIHLLESWDPVEEADRQKPMVFAFFGRGRVMPPIIGAGINADVLQEDATFLIGPCSCQIKDQNPGFDMLMQVNWDGVIQGEYTLAEAMPILTTPQAAAGVNKALTNLNIVQLDPTAKTVANSNGGNAGAATIALAEPISAMWRNLGIVIGAGIVFVLAIGLSMKMMGKNDRSQY